MVAFALALVVLIVAAAKPQKTVAVPVERASIMLATDVSRSMDATDVAPNRLVAAKRAARAFLDEVPARVNVGILAFNRVRACSRARPATATACRGAIDKMTASGTTATGDAIDAGVRVLRAAKDRNGRRPPGAIVLISDGKATRGRDPVVAAQAARRVKIPVLHGRARHPPGTLTVPKRGGGTTTEPVPPDPASLAQIARASGGKAFTAQTASGLKEVYQRLAPSSATRTRSAR
jgi:Ca-activated chloride channel family protein